MWNRLALAAALCLALALPAAAQEDKPYRVSLTGDSFDGTAWHTGVMIELAPGWKTYWRMPGESGVAPEFTWQPSRPARVEVAFPTPSRHVDQSGEAIGYEEQVLFPVTVTPETPGDLALKLDLFFAVCKDICVPAQAEASIELSGEERDPLGSVRVEQARSRLPDTGSAVTGAALVMENGKPVLELTLKERPDDIFIETDSSAYVRAPAFAADGRSARLVIDGLSDPARLKGRDITITYTLGGKGHAQTLKLP